MKYSWYRLDNSAIVYQMVITQNAQSLYRLGVKLHSNVDKTALITAVNDALKRFPYFKSELKHGFFRPYLDENKHSPIVEEDDGILLKILNFKKNNGYLFRTTYFGTRIFIDFFHGLCDGTGALEFFKSVLYYYFKALGKEFPSDNIITQEVPINPEETEDAFARYYKKPNLKKGIDSMASGTAYRLKGKKFIYEGFGLIQATVSTNALLDTSRKLNCSITVLLTALMLYSVSIVYNKDTFKHPLTAFIPINLRKKFPSRTLTNFTVFAKLVIPRNIEYTLENIILTVKDLLEKQLDENEILLKMGFSSLMAKFPLLKYMPLFIKTHISRISRNLSPSKQTFILSNVGKVNIDSDLIDHFFLNLNCNSKTPKNIAVISYKDKTNISFTRKLIDTDVEQVFFKELAKLCGNVEIVSNFREENNAL